MAEPKWAVGMVQDVWDAVAQLNSLRGLLFVCSIGAFVDAGLAHLGMGTLMTIDWHTRPPGPGPVLWGLAAFIAMPLLVARAIQALLGLTIGPWLWRWWHREDTHPPRYDELLAHQLLELALFEKDTQLEAHVRRFTERWSSADEEGDKLMQQSWACTLWMGIAVLTPEAWIHGAVVDALLFNGFGCLLVMIGAVVICGPWFLHLSAEPFPLRHIYVRGARARYVRMCARRPLEVVDADCKDSYASMS